MKDEYCNDCMRLNPNEKDQERHQPHMCGKYKKQVYHLGMHPKIYRCDECLKDNPIPIVMHTPRYRYPTKVAMVASMIAALNQNNPEE